MANLSKQGKKLLEFYEQMASEGFDRTDGKRVLPDCAYNSFQLRKFRNIAKDIFSSHNIKSVLDYGGGGSDWDAPGFDPISGFSAKDFFKLNKITKYEPARDLQKKIKSDCVVCMDVLEHIFIADLTAVIEELFTLSERLLVVNVACYEAAALLPNGDNAHITIRPPAWWKGAFDMLSSKYPKVELLLICSTTFNQGLIYEAHKFENWENSKQFTISLKAANFTLK